MVKQKMVLKLSMEDPKKRSKALQIAAGFTGVTSTSLEGDRIVVVGDGVDPVTLTAALRKRMGYAELISVAVVEEKKEEKKETAMKSVQPTPLPYHNFTVVPPYPYPYPYAVQQDCSYDNSCTIM
ncbi:uncharacterized protein LOC109724637 [Ananas comosus]|uniref:Uncharacterized protein LOC109724637 n=1 Tax=Ananas comosus TaxID=4615 RepID=A0A6P5GTA2_ANACO|nr:uncharacterized protein LOC109724637 [Ananas comosus]